MAYIHRLDWRRPWHTYVCLPLLSYPLPRLVLPIGQMCFTILRVEDGMRNYAVEE